MGTLHSHIQKMPAILQGRYSVTNVSYWVNWANQLLTDMAMRGIMPILQKEVGVVPVNGSWIDKPYGMVEAQDFFSPLNVNRKYRVKETNNRFKILDYEFVQGENNLFKRDTNINVVSGKSFTIRWDSEDFIVDDGSGNPINATVKIELSVNGGDDWTTVIASATNTGSYAWSVTSSATTEALIKLSCVEDSTISDISQVFEIFSSDTAIRCIDSRVVSGKSFTIRWDSEDFIVDDGFGNSVNATVKVEVSINGGVDWTSIVDSIDNTGSYVWHVTSSATTEGLIRLSCVEDATISDVSEVFEIFSFNTVVSYSPAYLDLNVSVSGKNELTNHLLVVTVGSYSGRTYIIGASDVSVNGSTRVYFLHQLPIGLTSTQASTWNIYTPEAYVMIDGNFVYTEISSYLDEVPIEAEFESLIVPAYLRWKAEEDKDPVAQEAVYWQQRVVQIFSDINALRNRRVQTPPKGRRLVGFENSKRSKYRLS